MRRFNKKTITLILASVLTVASVNADSFKNTIMGLSLGEDGNGGVKLTVKTKTRYDSSITAMKRDANTYIITMPEVSNQAEAPSNVEIVTRPYTSTGKGYTRITVRVNSDKTLSTTNEVYDENSSDSGFTKVHSTSQEYEVKNNDIENEQKYSQPHNVESYQKNNATKPVSGTMYDDQSFKSREVNTTSRKTEDASLEIFEKPVVERTQDVSSQASSLDSTNTLPADNSQQIIIAMGALCILLVSILLIKRAKTNIVDIVGENLNIDVEEGSQKNKKTVKDSKYAKIRKTINKLDAMYTSTIPKSYNEYTPAPSIQQPSVEEEPVNIVDLDELFQEKTKEQLIEDSEENDALEDFLNNFSFDEIIKEENNEEFIDSQSYDEEFYEKVLANSNLNFTKEDMSCIQALLNIEVYDDTLKNIDKYAVSNPIKDKTSRDSIIDKLVIDYSISQNIMFTQEDISIIRKLANVEIDKNFIKDLRTNPERTKQMYNELEHRPPKTRKPSEMLVLNVKSELPNLSEELKALGGVPIKSEVKPTVVYYSEGYDYKKLHIDVELPDLSKEVNNEVAYVTRPSDDVYITDETYEVDKLKITGLPDLKDAVAHPEQYKKESKPEVIANEEDLLNRIQNVQFKPFYEETDSVDEHSKETVPDVNDIKKELEELGNVEVADEENISVPSTDDYDDFEELYKETYFDLDKYKDNIDSEEKVQEQENCSDDDLLNEIVDTNANQQEEQKVIEKVDNKIEETKKTKNVAEHVNQLRKQRMLQRAKNKVKDKKESINSTKQINEYVKCIIDGEEFNIISTTTLQDNIGCHLATTSKGAVILAFEGSKLRVFRHYDALTSKHIQARLTVNPDGTAPRYIIRNGKNKFIVEIKNNHIEFVMDLC